MSRTLLLLASLPWVLAGSHPAEAASGPHRFVVEVLVDGRPLPEYAARGTRYIEAAKGKEYAIRLRNPLGVRIAVALSVDGLNTIDARRTSAMDARKWVLDPYQTVVISGWQTSRDHARRFYFTSEEQSYAGWLGRTDDLGVISAVVFRERVPPARPSVSPRESERSDLPRQSAPAAPAGSSPAPNEAAPLARDSAADAAAKRQEADEYAATGIGRETRHHVERVYFDLDETPLASVSLRYEYRPQLVALGILPPVERDDRLGRRERARGFEPGFCPVPGRPR